MLALIIVVIHHVMPLGKFACALRQYLSENSHSKTLQRHTARDPCIGYNTSHPYYYPIFNNCGCMRQNKELTKEEFRILVTEN